MKYCYALLLLCFLIPGLHAQNADTAQLEAVVESLKWAIRIKNYEKAARDIDSVYLLYKTAYGEQSAPAASFLRLKGLNCYYYGKYDSAQHWYEKALSIRNSLPDSSTSANRLSAAVLYDNLGLVQTELGLYRMALANHEKALHIREEHAAPGAVDIAYSWGNVGKAQSLFGEYYMAEDLCRKAIPRLLATKPPIDWAAVASIQNNLAGVLSRSGQLDSAILWYKNAETTFKRISRMNPNNYADEKIRIAIFQNMSAAYLFKKEYQVARDTLAAALKFCGNKKRLEPLRIDLYNNIAAAWIESKVPDSSFYWSYRSIALSQQIYGKGHSSAGLGYTNLASAYSVVQPARPDLAATYLDSAFLVLGGETFRPDRLLARISSKDLDERVGFDTLLNRLGVLKAFGEIAQREHFISAGKIFLEYCRAAYTSTGDILYLRKAEKMSFLIDRYFDYCRSALSDVEARQVLQGFAFNYYERSTAIQYSLMKNTRERELPLRRAFYFSEKSKALTLFESVRAARVLDIKGVDTVLLKEEERQRSAVANAEKKYFTARDMQAAETDIIKKKEKGKAVSEALAELAEKRLALEQILKQLRKNSSYQQARQTAAPITLEETQRALCNTGTTVMSYIAGDTSLYIIVINHDRVDLVEIEKKFPLEEWVRIFRDTIDAPASAEYHENETSRMHANRCLAEHAYLLYQHLIAPVIPLLRANIVLIPDGPLCALPFEALLRAPVGNQVLKPSRWDYLLHHFNIRYAYSASLLQEMSNQKTGGHPSRRFAGFAPWYEGRSRTFDCNEKQECKSLRNSGVPLYCSGQEIYCIGQQFTGVPALFYGKEATVGQFRKIAGEYGILHLSLHGEADEQVGNNAALVFSNTSRLYVRELYNLHLNAELVVLSACKTGLGAFRRGEGIISLSRGFALAGAQSILSAIWSTSDGGSRTEMMAFYQHALSGKSKSAALTEAKRLMAKNTRRDDAHPFYWAGFLLSGADTPLRQ
ncbi:MAG: CHAT domain-containing protein [Saprospiraceae bacterium]|nr:CHAT domain-containing protein [Saprospiraceae bacterium]